jgi:glycosyltransferase involved in cell wall biosynthesis
MVTTPSAFLLEQMKPYRADIILLRNPIDLSAYHFKPRPNPEPRLIWLRAFHNIYNPGLAPRVIVKLVKEFPEIHLTMIGRDKGSLLETKRMAADLGVAHCITFQNSIPKSEVPVWLNRHDIFINTTNVDNAPVSVVEAMACGLCVVSTDVGGIPYLIEHETDALLTPADDVDAMASAVRRVLTEATLAAKLGQNARQKAEQFDWSAILPQWERILTDAANERAGASRDE